VHFRAEQEAFDEAGGAVAIPLHVRMVADVDFGAAFGAAFDDELIEGVLEGVLVFVEEAPVVGLAEAGLRY